jgi:hypothetical protein
MRIRANDHEGPHFVACVCDAVQLFQILAVAKSFLAESTRPRRAGRD